MPAPDFSPHGDLHEGQFARLVPEFDLLPLAGVPFWDETVLYHRPTQTLLGADIVCSAGSNDHFTWRFGARLTGCYEQVRVPPDARKKLEDKSAAARSLLLMLQRPAERLIVGHRATKVALRATKTATAEFNLDFSAESMAS